MRYFPKALKLILITLVCAIGLGRAQAHEIIPSIIDLEIEPSGRVVLEIETNAEAMLAEIGPEHDDTQDAPNAAEYDQLRALAPDQFQARFDAFSPQLLDGISLSADGARVALDYSGILVPEIGNLSQSRQSIITLEGQLPSDAEFLIWSWDEKFGSNIIRINADSDTPYADYLEGGMSSEAIAVSGPQERGLIAVIADYIAIGFTHIVPKGLDHILFVVGIFLASTTFRPLLLQVSAFTVAHTVTLALGILGVVNISPAIVEPLIALSIAYVCVENIFFSKMTAWRPLIVFGFGLLHGLGFAGVLLEIGLTPSEFIVGLISFNVGVELGQLSVIAICFALVGYWFGQKHYYRRLVVIPASTLIGAIGLFWFVERIVA